jgi:hypothetical protein
MAGFAIEFSIPSSRVSLRRLHPRRLKEALRLDLGAVLGSLGTGRFG